MRYALLVLLGSTAMAAAQTPPAPAEMGITHDPTQSIMTLDASGTWVAIGYIDPVSHIFSGAQSGLPAGSVAAGAFVPGAVLAGAYADGAIVTQGSKSDPPWNGTDPAPTAMAIWKKQDIDTRAPIAGQTAVNNADVDMGGVKIIDGSSTSSTAASPAVSVSDFGSVGTEGMGVQGGGPGGAPVAVMPPNILTGKLVKGVTATAMAGTASVQLIAGVPGARLYITRIQCYNASATTDTAVTIQDSDGTTPVMIDSMAASHNYGGEAQTSPLPLFWTTAGNGIYVADTVSGAAVMCSASGFSN